MLVINFSCTISPKQTAAIAAEMIIFLLKFELIVLELLKKLCHISSSY